MSYRYQEGFQEQWIDKVMDLHNKTEMKRPKEMQERVLRAFQNRSTVITCWDEEKLIGIGSLITDGEMYSSIFDVVIDPDYQKQGVGKSIMNKLVIKVSHTCIYLTSTFGNETFYQKLGFKGHKTAFAKYPFSSPYLEEECSKKNT